MRFTYTLLACAHLSLAACPDQGKGGSDTDTTAATDTAASTAATTSDTTTATDTTTPTTALTLEQFVPCADAVPQDGTGPCENEGEDCKFEDDACVAFTGAKCTNGVWVQYENVPGPECGSSACEPPNFPNEGDPCTEEGASCSGDCSDQCSFCNILACEGGVWMRVEVFPAPCLECDALCDFVIVPMCAGGPPDKAACVAGCEENKVGACKAEFSALRGCSGKEPTFSCDAAERPLVVGCEAEFAGFYDCLMP